MVNGPAEKTPDPVAVNRPETDEEPGEIAFHVSRATAGLTLPRPWIYEVVVLKRLDD